MSLAWLHYLDAQPEKLASFLTWLKEQEQLCTNAALDVPAEHLPTLRGKRDAFRTMQGTVHNTLSASRKLKA